MSYFPILVVLVGTGEELVVSRPEEIPAMAFKVLKTGIV